MAEIVIDLEILFSETAKLSDLPAYIAQAVNQSGEGNEVVLTGKAPVWLYLAIAHALHGKARKLLYRSPVTDDVVIFDHDPFKDQSPEEKRKILFITATADRKYNNDVFIESVNTIELEFIDYTSIDNKLANNAYKEEYEKIVYHHPYSSSDPCYVRLVERLKSNQSSLPLITFLDDNCVDFQVGRTYPGTIFTTTLLALILSINK